MVGRRTIHMPAWAIIAVPMCSPTCQSWFPAECQLLVLGGVRVKISEEAYPAQSSSQWHFRLVDLHRQLCLAKAHLLRGLELRGCLLGFLLLKPWLKLRNGSFL